MLFIPIYTDPWRKSIQKCCEVTPLVTRGAYGEALYPKALPGIPEGKKKPHPEVSPSGTRLRAQPKRSPLVLQGSALTPHRRWHLWCCKVVRLRAHLWCCASRSRRGYLRCWRHCFTIGCPSMMKAEPFGDKHFYALLLPFFNLCSKSKFSSKSSIYKKILDS